VHGNQDSAFLGAIPGLYDRYLGPLLFSPFATEMARRAEELDPQRILETAAGTGIMTSALHRACPQATFVALADEAQGLPAYVTRVGRFDATALKTLILPQVGGARAPQPGAEEAAAQGAPQAAQGTPETLMARPSDELRNVG
jgi:hypothetical protein